MMPIDRLDPQYPRVTPRTILVARAQLAEQFAHVLEGGEEDLLRAGAGGVAVAFAEGNEFFGQALGFLGFVPGGPDGFVGYEGGDEVAEEGLTVGGVAVEVAVFDGAAGHDGEVGSRGLGKC